MEHRVDSDKLFETRPTPKELGRIGEECASEYLRAHGYQIVERNWSCTWGEADIVARAPEESQWVLVEVKTRFVQDEADDTRPELAVTAHKQERYRRIALCYLGMHGDVESIRFDVIALCLKGPTCGHIRHFIHAFEWNE
jgi:putative endonuclease